MCMEMCWQTQSDGDPPLHAPLCTARWERLWSAVFGSRIDKHASIELPGGFWCSGGIYGVDAVATPHRQMIVSELTWVIKVLMLITVTSLETVHLISCFLGVFLKYWFDFLFQFLRIQRVFCFPALAHLLHNPLATSASAPVSCWFPGRLVGDPECNLAARAVLQK